MAGVNRNVPYDTSWDEMFKDEEPSDSAGSDRPMRRPHPKHPDSTPSVEYEKPGSRHMPTEEMGP